MRGCPRSRWGAGSLSIALALISTGCATPSVASPARTPQATPPAVQRAAPVAPPAAEPEQEAGPARLEPGGPGLVPLPASADVVLAVNRSAPASTAPAEAVPQTLGQVSSLRFSPDGSLLAVVGDGSLAVVDAATGAIRMMRSAPYQIGGAVTPDGRAWVEFDSTGTRLLLVAANRRALGDDGEVSFALYDLATGATLARSFWDEPMDAVALSPDGETLATTVADDTEGRLTLISTRDGSSTDRPLGPWARLIGYTPSGRRLAVVSEEALELREPDGSPGPRIRIDSDRSIFEGLVSFRPTGGFVGLYTREGFDLHDVATGERVSSIRTDDELTWSANGRWLHAPWGEPPYDVDVDRAEVIRRAALDMPDDLTLTWEGESPDGSHIYRAYHDGSILELDRATGRLLRTLRPAAAGDSESEYWARDLSPSGRELAAASSAELSLIDIASGAVRWSIPIAQAPGESWRVSWAPDGKSLATYGADGAVVWGGGGDARATRCPRLPETEWINEVLGLAFGAIVLHGPHGSATFVGSSMSYDMPGETAGPRICQLDAPGREVADLTAVAEDGSRYLTVEDDAVVVRNTAGGGELARFRREELGSPIRVATLSDDGRRVAVAAGFAVKVLDVASRRPIRTFPMTLGSRRVDLSPDGRVVVIVDGAGIHTFDVTTGEPRFTPDCDDWQPSHDWRQVRCYSEGGIDVLDAVTGAPVASINLSAYSGDRLISFDDRRVFAESEDGVGVFDLQTAQLLGSADAGPHWAPFPSDTRVATCSDAGITVVDLADGSERSFEGCGCDPSLMRAMDRSAPLSVSPDGRFVATPGPVTHVLRLSDGQCLSLATRFDRGAPLALAASDGRGRYWAPRSMLGRLRVREAGSIATAAMRAAPGPGYTPSLVRAFLR